MLSHTIQFHAVGDWTEMQVRARWVSQSSRPIIPAIETLIEQAWTGTLAKPGVHLFDGPMCRLETWQTSDQQLQLEFSPTSYKPFLGTNLAHPELAEKYGPKALANPVGVSIALETSDGRLLLGRRSATVAYYPSRIHPFAGALEPRDGTKIFSAVYRELGEELSLERSEIVDLRCTGLVEDRLIRQPELIFRAKAPLGSDELESRMDPAEHNGVYRVDANAAEIERAIANAALTPVAVAALLLWARSKDMTIANLRLPA